MMGHTILMGKQLMTMLLVISSRSCHKGRSSILRLLDELFDFQITLDADTRNYDYHNPDDTVNTDSKHIVIRIGIVQSRTLKNETSLIVGT